MINTYYELGSGAQPGSTVANAVIPPARSDNN